MQVGDMQGELVSNDSADYHTQHVSVHMYELEDMVTALWVSRS